MHVCISYGECTGVFSKEIELELGKRESDYKTLKQSLLSIVGRRRGCDRTKNDTKCWAKYIGCSN